MRAAGSSLFCGRTSHSSGDQVFTQGATAAKALRQGEGHKQRLKETHKEVSEKTHTMEAKKNIAVLTFIFCYRKPPVLEELRKFLPSHVGSLFISGGHGDGDGYSHNSGGLYANVLLPVCVGKIALWLLARHQSSSARCRRRRRLANVLIDSQASSKDLHFYYKAGERRRAGMI